MLSCISFLLLLHIPTGPWAEIKVLAGLLLSGGWRVNLLPFLFHLLEVTCFSWFVAPSSNHKASSGRLNPSHI